MSYYTVDYQSGHWTPNETEWYQTVFQDIEDGHTLITEVVKEPTNLQPHVVRAGIYTRVDVPHGPHWRWISWVDPIDITLVAK